MKGFVGSVLQILAKTAIAGLFFLLTCNATATTTACRPLLWPAEISPSSSIPEDIRAELIRWSDTFISQSPHPVPILSSSGKTSINDPALIASRKALKDADRAAVLALSYRLTNKADYLNKAKSILTRWANVNEPTGNPIDETRLEGMIWAYDLIACDLSEKDKNQILDWFESIRTKKADWEFGSITSTNNYRIHQIKMLLLLNKILRHEQSFENNTIAAEKYSSINLNPETGTSIDFLERSALYYHNYVMQPWLEISLITGCCEQPVKKGFSFLSHKILSNKIGGEFKNSDAQIDKLRAKGGFKYAAKGGLFDVKKAAPTIIMYYTLVNETPKPDLWSIQQHAKPSPWMSFLSARRALW